jgi:Na+-transporting NADH:ubiquinone oxidoreductase subunit NqrB
MDAAREELLREYYWAQKRIGEFDNQQLTIKSWSATASAAVFATYFANGDVRILLVACTAALIFWYIEAQWKSFQMISMRHSRFLEGKLRRREAYDGPTYSDAYANAFGRWTKTKRFLKAASIANVWLPHLPIALAAAGLYCWQSGGLAEFMQYFGAVVNPKLGS